MSKINVISLVSFYRVVRLFVRSLVRAFFSLMSFVRNDYIRYCDSSGGSEWENGRKGKKEKECVCVQCAYEYVCVCMFTNVRVHKKVAEKSENVQILYCERGAREKGIEIRILL